MNRSYEIMYIIRPDLTDEDLDKLITSHEHNVETAGGKLQNTDRMGKRRLAYPVRKFGEGIYVLMNVEGEGKVVAEIERRLRVSEPVIKFITVRKDELDKKLAKIQQIRSTRIKRSASEPAPESAGAPAASPEPAPAA
ncbi:MAG: 30S ribosomal protein S6 [Acidobacteriales bacterium]|nr:30S ribosomal protein S6 [Terriglobales bacterium]